MAGAVILKDARGCWTKYALTPGDRFEGEGDQVFIRAGQIWRGVPFVATGRTREGLLVFQSARPLIGPADEPYRSTYLPVGWSYPW